MLNLTIKKNIIIIANIYIRKNLIYQVIFKVTKGIILVIFLIIVFMKN